MLADITGFHTKGTFSLFLELLVEVRAAGTRNGFSSRQGRRFAFDIGGDINPYNSMLNRQ